MDISFDWEFSPGWASRRWLAGAGCARAEAVDLPHCWNEQDTFEEGAVYRQGWGSYRKTLDAIPALDPGVRCQLALGGFYGFGDLWLNGRKHMAVDGQYLGLRTMIETCETPLTIAIRVSNEFMPHVLPGIRYPDFLLHGGLTGGAALTFRHALHFDTAECRVDTAQVGDGVLNVNWRVRNEGSLSRFAAVRCRIVDMAGHVVVPEWEISARACGPNQALGGCERIEAGRFERWHPNSPTLYRAELRIRGDGIDTDRLDLRFGVRVAEFRAGEGFILNGSRVALRGCNRHESMPGFGHALPASLQRADVERIKSMGMNFVRLSHYPQHPAFLDACDELGVMVYAEIASWKSVRTGKWLQAAERQLRGMIKRDRHHPAIIVWGMGNEARSRPAYRRLMSLARELDPGRPVTYAENHLYRARRKRTLGMPDVWGLNYEFDAMEQALQASSTRTVIVSECSNEPETVRGDLARELRQVQTLQADLARVGDDPAVAGYALWCFNDYATMRKDRYRRFSGVMDAWRQPKLAAFLLEALNAERPVLHLVADWSEHGHRAERDVHVFTNCGSFALQVNGEERFRTGEGQPHSMTTLAFEPGLLTASGHGPFGRVDVQLASFGHAVALAFADPCPGEAPASRATLVVRVMVVDANGREVSTWNGRVRAHVGGGARLRCHRANGEIDVSRGTGMLYIAGTGRGGDAAIRVEHAELTPVERVIRFHQ